MTTQEKFSKWNPKVHIHIPYGKLAGTFLFWDTFIKFWIFLWILQGIYIFHKLLLVKDSNTEAKLVPWLMQLLTMSPLWFYIAKAKDT